MSTLPSPAQPPMPTPRRISRRVLIAGLAGSLIAGGGIVAWVRTQSVPAISHTPDPTAIIKSHPLPTATSTVTASASPTAVVSVHLPFTYRGHSDQVYSVAWSPDGARLASGGLGDIIQIWSASTGEQLLAYEGHTAKVYSVAWSPDNRFIASGHYDATVQVWNALNGSSILTYQGHINVVQALAWSSDSTRVASASNDKTVQICSAI